MVGEQQQRGHAQLRDLGTPVVVLLHQLTHAVEQQGELLRMRRDGGVALVERRLLHHLGLRRAHGFHALEDFGIPALARGGGGDDDQVAHHLGMLDRHPDRRIAAVRVAGDIGLRDLQVPQHRGDVIAVSFVTHRGGAQRRAAVPLEVDADHLTLARQRADRLRHRADVPQPAGQHHDRLTFSVDLVIDAQALGSLGMARVTRLQLFLLAHRCTLAPGRAARHRRDSRAGKQRSDEETKHRGSLLTQSGDRGWLRNPRPHFFVTR